MTKRKISSIFFVLIFLVSFFVFTDNVKAVTCTSVGTGNWTTNGTWTDCGSGVPQPNDNVVIPTGSSVTITTLINRINNLTIVGTLTQSTTTQ